MAALGQTQTIAEAAVRRKAKGAGIAPVANRDASAEWTYTPALRCPDAPPRRPNPSPGWLLPTKDLQAMPPILGELLTITTHDECYRGEIIVAKLHDPIGVKQMD